MKRYVYSLFFPLALSTSACTDSTSNGGASDAASTSDIGNSDTPPSTTEDVNLDGADGLLEIGPPKAPLGNCDVEAKGEGISSHDWCSRELQVNAVCNEGECVEAQPGGLPSGPPKPPPTTPPAG